MDPCLICPPPLHGHGVFHPADRPHEVGLGTVLVACAAPGCDAPEHPMLPTGLCPDHILVKPPLDGP